MKCRGRACGHAHTLYTEGRTHTPCFPTLPHGSTHFDNGQPEAGRGNGTVHPNRFFKASHSGDLARKHGLSHINSETGACTMGVSSQSALGAYEGLAAKGDMR